MSVGQYMYSFVLYYVVAFRVFCEQLIMIRLSANVVYVRFHSSGEYEVNNMMWTANNRSILHEKMPLGSISGVVAQYLQVVRVWKG